MNGRPEISKLCDIVRKEMIRINYGVSAIVLYDTAVKDLLSYAEKRNIKYFSQEDYATFMRETYNFPSPERTGSYPYRAAKARNIQKISDFQLYGFLQKQCRKDPFSKEMTDILADFQEKALSRLIKESTLVKDNGGLMKFIRFLEDANIQIEKLTPQDIACFLSTLQYLSKYYRIGVCSVVRNFLGFLYQEGYITQDLSPSVPHIHCPDDFKIPKSWQDEDITKILNAVDRGSPVGKRDYAIILLALRLGFRKSDILGLKFENIDWNNHIIKFVQQKTGIPHSLPLTEDVGWAIIDYLKNGRPKSASDSVFLSSNPPYNPLTVLQGDFLSKYRFLTDIPVEREKSRGLHSLRHTLASRLLVEGTPLESISAVLGQISPDSIHKYLHLDIEMLRKCALNPNEVII